MYTQVVGFLLAAASLVHAGTIAFIGQDSISRTIYCTPNAGLAPVPPTVVPAGQKVTVDFGYGWTGNCFSVSEGSPVVPGMLAEVAFDAYAGATFFDVSAIVNPADTNGVKEMFPTYDYSPVSGCKTFPCPNCYYHPDDVQTKAFHGSDLTCTLGTGPSSSKRNIEPEESENFARDLVLGLH